MGESDELARGEMGPARAPGWVLVAAVAMGALTLVYLMAVVMVVILMEVSIDTEGARFLLLGIMALGVAMSTAFVGGRAAMTGRIRLPFISVQEHPVLVSISGGVLVFLLVFLVGAAVWGRTAPPTDPRSPTERSAINLKTQIAKLRGNFEMVTRKDSIEPMNGNPQLVAETKERAIQLAANLLALDEATMNYPHLITKWQYAAYAYCMAASLEQDVASRIWLAQKVTWAAEYALTLIELVRKRAAAGEDGYAVAVDFVERDHAEARIAYLIAVGKAIRLHSGDGSVEAADLKSAVAKIPRSYYGEAMPQWNPWIAQYIAAGGAP